MGFLKLCAVPQLYLLLKIQNLKLLIQVLTKFPNQSSPFSQNHTFLFIFLDHKIPLLYQRDVKIQLLQSLSCLYSRTADGSNSAPAKVIEGKLQYPHNSTTRRWKFCLPHLQT